VLVADPPARVFVAGDTTVDLHPDETLAPGSGLRWFPGGTGANVARGLALLDRPPALATRVGADPFGRAIDRRLTALGIDSADRVRDDRPSPVTTPDPGADRSGDSWTAWVRDTCYGFDLPDRGALAGADVFHCSGTVLPPAVDGPTVAAAIDAAEARDVAVSFDLNGRHNQWSSPAAYADALATPLAAADLVFAGDHDLAVAGREPTFDGLRGLFPGSPSALAVLTRGADGAGAVRFADGEVVESASHPGFTVDVADPSGAGDALAAAVVGLIARGIEDLDRLLAVGAAAGAATVASPGPFCPADRERMASLLADADLDWPSAWDGDR